MAIKKQSKGIVKPPAPQTPPKGSHPITPPGGSPRRPSTQPRPRPTRPPVPSLFTQQREAGPVELPPPVEEQQQPIVTRPPLTVRGGGRAQPTGPGPRLPAPPGLLGGLDAFMSRVRQASLWEWITGAASLAVPNVVGPLAAAADPNTRRTAYDLTVGPGVARVAQIPENISRPITADEARDPRVAADISRQNQDAVTQGYLSAYGVPKATGNVVASAYSGKAQPVTPSRPLVEGQPPTNDLRVRRYIGEAVSTPLHLLGEAALQTAGRGVGALAQSRAREFDAGIAPQMQSAGASESDITRARESYQWLGTAKWVNPATGKPEMLRPTQTDRMTADDVLTGRDYFEQNAHPLYQIAVSIAGDPLMVYGTAKHASTMASRAERVVASTVRASDTPIDDVARTVADGTFWNTKAENIAARIPGVKQLITRPASTSATLLTEHSLRFLDHVASMSAGPENTVQVWKALGLLASKNADEAARGRQMVESLGLRRVVSADEAKQLVAAGYRVGDIASPLESLDGQATQLVMRQMGSAKQGQLPKLFDAIEAGIATTAAPELKTAGDKAARQVLRMLADAATEVVGGKAGALEKTAQAMGEYQGLYARYVQIGTVPGVAVRNAIQNVVNGVMNGTLTSLPGKGLDTWIRDTWRSQSPAITRGVGLGGEAGSGLAKRLEANAAGRLANRTFGAIAGLNGKVENAFSSAVWKHGVDYVFDNTWQSEHILSGEMATQLRSLVGDDILARFLGGASVARHPDDIDRMVSRILGNKTWHLPSPETAERLRTNGLDVAELVRIADDSPDATAFKRNLDAYELSLRQSVNGAQPTTIAADPHYDEYRQTLQARGISGSNLDEMVNAYIAKREPARAHVEVAERLAGQDARSAGGDWAKQYDDLRMAQHEVSARLGGRLATDWQGLSDASPDTIAALKQAHAEAWTQRFNEEIDAYDAFRRGLPQSEVADDVVREVTGRPPLTEQAAAMADRGQPIAVVPTTGSSLGPVKETDVIEAVQQRVAEFFGGPEGMASEYTSEGLRAALRLSDDIPLSALKDAGLIERTPSGLYQFTEKARSLRATSRAATAIPEGVSSKPPVSPIGERPIPVSPGAPPDPATVAKVRLPKQVKALRDFRDTTLLNWGTKYDGLTGEAVAELKSAAQVVKGRLVETRLVADKFGTALRDGVYFNYGDRRNADMAARIIWAYPYWYSREAAFIARQYFNNPHALWVLYNFREQVEKMNADLPPWMRQSLTMRVGDGGLLSFPILANIDPTDAFLRPDFHDPVISEDKAGRAFQTLNDYGPGTVNMLVPQALGALAAYAGKDELAYAYAGYVGATTRTIANLTGQAPVEAALGVVLPQYRQMFDSRGKLVGTKWDRDKLGAQAAKLVAAGEITPEMAVQVKFIITDPFDTERMKDPAYAAAYQIFDRILEMNRTEQALPSVLSWLGGPAGRFRTQTQVQIEEAGRRYAEIAAQKATLDPEAYRKLVSEFFLNPESLSYSISLLWKKQGDEAREAAVWNFLSRVGRGQQDDPLMATVGMDSRLRDEFYAAKGIPEDWTSAERGKFFGAIGEIGAMVALPELATAKEWDEVGQRRSDLEAELDKEFGEGVREWVDAYYAADDKEAYATVHPEVMAFLNRRGDRLMADPLLAAYYASQETVYYWLLGEFNEQHAEGAIVHARWQELDRLGKTDPDAKAIAAEYKAENLEAINVYSQAKDDFYTMVDARIVAIRDKLPDVEKPELRTDVPTQEFEERLAETERASQPNRPQDDTPGQEYDWAKQQVESRRAEVQRQREIDAGKNGYLSGDNRDTYETTLYTSIAEQVAGDPEAAREMFYAVHPEGWQVYKALDSANELSTYTGDQSIREAILTDTGNKWTQVVAWVRTLGPEQIASLKGQFPDIGYVASVVQSFPDGPSEAARAAIVGLKVTFNLDGSITTSRMSVKDYLGGKFGSGGGSGGGGKKPAARKGGGGGGDPAPAADPGQVAVAYWEQAMTQLSSQPTLLVRLMDYLALSDYARSGLLQRYPDLALYLSRLTPEQLAQLERGYLAWAIQTGRLSDTQVAKYQNTRPDIWPILRVYAKRSGRTGLTG